MTADDPLAGLLAEPGLSFRGGLRTASRSSLRIGTCYRHHGDLLSTHDARLATNNFTDPDIIAILGDCGIDTTPLAPGSSDLEVVHRGDVEFTVVGSQPIDHRLWLTTILIDDRDRFQQLDVDQAMRRIATAVLRALSLPAADVRDQSRYAGPIGVDSSGRLDPIG